MAVSSFLEEGEGVNVNLQITPTIDLISHNLIKLIVKNEQI